jgi:hypothetical protein
MRRKNISNDRMNIKRYNICIIMLGLLICIYIAGPGNTSTAYGQGTAAEALGTMELSQEVDNAANKSTPKRAIDMAHPAKDANNTPAVQDRNPDNARQGIRPPAAPVQQENNTAASESEVQTAAPNAAPAAPAEANVIIDANDFNTFKQELDRIDLEARGEDAQWMGRQLKKSELAKAMDDVVVAELKFLKKVAAAEKDANTVEAIDLLLKKRQDRLSKLVTKLDTEMKDERKQQAAERQQNRRPTRTSGAQQTDQGQTERPTRSTNPARRAVGGGAGE